MWMARQLVIATLAIAGIMVGCATTPKTAEEREDLQASAQRTLQRMTASDPGLSSLLQSSYGYAVFPSIGKGGVIVGAAYGRGVVYEQGRMVGYVELNQGSLGAQLGGQSFAELVVFRDRFALDRLKTGQFSVGGNASAVALTAGAASSAQFTEGVAIFVMPRGGLMAELSVSGQQINFRPTSG